MHLSQKASHWYSHSALLPSYCSHLLHATTNLLPFTLSFQQPDPHHWANYSTSPTHAVNILSPQTLFKNLLLVHLGVQQPPLYILTLPRQLQFLPMKSQTKTSSPLFIGYVCCCTSTYPLARHASAEKKQRPKQVSHIQK